MALQKNCAWCGKDMGSIPGEQTGVTHGICPDCLKKYFGKEVEEVEETEQHICAMSKLRKTHADRP